VRARPFPIRFFFVVVALLAARAASAADGGDGVYGLLDTDTVLALGAGAGVLHDFEPPDASGLGAEGFVELRPRLLGAASLVVGYTGRTPHPQHDAVRHAGVLAVELRPLFFALFFENRFSGDAFSDLVLYGVGLTGGFEASSDGLALLVGLGTEWPLARVRSRGLFLRTEVRARVADASWLGRGSGDDRSDVALLVSLQHHWPVDLGLVR
jgi:hypothetical protein